MMMMTMAYDNKPYVTSVYARSWCSYAELIAMITFVISCLLLKFNGLTLYGYVYVVHALPVEISTIIAKAEPRKQLYSHNSNDVVMLSSRVAPGTQRGTWRVTARYLKTHVCALLITYGVRAVLSIRILIFRFIAALCFCPR